MYTAQMNFFFYFLRVFRKIVLGGRGTDLYVHEIKVFSNKIDVTLKLNLVADKDGVGGGT